MRNRFQRRMMALVAAIVLAGVGIGCLTVRLQKEVSELQTRIKQVDSESFSIADQFGEKLRQRQEDQKRCDEQAGQLSLVH